MILKIFRKEISQDVWGNVHENYITEEYEIAERDFQHANTGYELEFKDATVYTRDLRIMFLRKQNAAIDINPGDVVEIDNKRFTVLQVQQFSKHKEVVVHGVE